MADESVGRHGDGVARGAGAVLLGVAANGALHQASVP